MELFYETNDGAKIQQQIKCFGGNVFIVLLEQNNHKMYNRGRLKRLLLIADSD